MQTLWQLYNTNPRPAHVECLGELIEFKKDAVKFHHVDIERPYTDDLVFHFISGNGHIKCRIVDTYEFNDLVNKLVPSQELEKAAEKLIDEPVEYESF